MHPVFNPENFMTWERIHPTQLQPFEIQAAILLRLSEILYSQQGVSAAPPSPSLVGARGTLVPQRVVLFPGCPLSVAYKGSPNN